MVWPFKGNILSSDGPSKKMVASMAKELDQLRKLTAQLQDELKSRDMAAGQISEYLYHYYPLLVGEWELEYIVLSGTKLRIYKTSQDQMYNPQEEIDVVGCTLEWEGLQSGRHWVFSILDSGGSLVVRLSALSSGILLKWVDAFAAVGCMQECTSGSESPLSGSEGASSRGLARRNSFEALPLAHSGSGTPKQPTSQRSTSLMPTVRGSPPTFDPSKSVKKKDNSKDVNSASEPVDAQAIKNTSFKSMDAEADDGEAKPSKKGGNTAAKDVAQHAKDDAKGTPAVGRTYTPPMSGSTPVHTALKSSYLSSDRIWHEKYTGLYNLALVVLVAANFRLILENLLMYGWRFNPLALLPGLTVGNPNLPLALCYPALLLVAFISLLTELLGYRWLKSHQKCDADQRKKGDGKLDEAQQQKLDLMAYRHESILLFINIVSACSAVILPCIVISMTNAEPLPGFVLLVLATVMWMKLISYHHCCWDVRQARRGGKVRGLGKPEKPGALRPGERGSASTPAEWATMQYPENLTTGNLFYFFAAPTLVYQVNYPHTPSIRVGWILMRVLELVLVSTLMGIITKQFLEPVLHSAIKPFGEMNWPHVIERVLRLALPSTYVWLCWFYCTFHLWLNILAELTCFGDREFYKDWWNASTLGEYWRLWNMPVHKWLLRHVYFPAIRFGMSRFNAMVLVFFVSAVLHEVLIGVPLHLVRYWVFFGMMVQIPLTILTEMIRTKLKRDELGNIIFWICFCILGQPMCVLIYTHDFLMSGKGPAATA